jgi:hypothetical protein
MRTKNRIVIIVVYSIMAMIHKLSASKLNDSLNKTSKHLIEINYGYSKYGGEGLSGGTWWPWIPDFSKRNTTSHQIGIQYEQNFNSSLSFGITYTFCESKSIYDSKYTVKYYKHRLLGQIFANARINKNMSIYSTFGAGFKLLQISSENKFQYENVFIHTNVLPFSIKIGLGIRLRLYKNIGLNTEIGIGGAMIKSGLNFRF